MTYLTLFIKVLNMTSMTLLEFKIDLSKWYINTCKKGFMDLD